MHTFKQLSLSMLLTAVAASTACKPVEPEDEGSSSAGMTDSATTGASAPTTSGDPDTGTPTTNTPTGNTPTSDPTGDPTGDPPAYVFDETPAADMVQLDRMGMPAVATAVISPELKNAYNESDPVGDAAGMFVPDITNNLKNLHAALDDDLTGLSLVPCEAMTCVTQAAPLVVPDTLQIDVSKPAGFPNGRLLTDPVVDITLAVVLLDLGVPGQTAASLIGTNPKANDKEFLPDFPYLAPGH